MPGPIVQIYEIQTPDEARSMIDLGVDHIGSVVTSIDLRHDPIIRETVSVVRKLGAVSSLIPLYTDQEAVFETLDYYQPHIVHFCDSLDGSNGSSVEAALGLQAAVRHQFPHVRIMRSIPIPQTAAYADPDSVLALAARMEPLSDYFLTDTVIVDDSGSADTDQPVTGFVGITGTTCDWSVAALLVAQSRIPVILAGGVAPENVAGGIQQVRPFGVDSCNCTNAINEDGQPIRFKKDPVRVELLLAQVQGAVRNRSA